MTCTVIMEQAQQIGLPGHDVQLNVFQCGLFARAIEEELVAVGSD